MLAAAVAAGLLLAPAISSGVEVDRGAPRTLRVAAAANLRGALDEVIRGFVEARPGVAVEPTYGASGTFFAQIQNGAPFDLFLSADEELPRRVAASGQADGLPFTYALGRLVLWVPAGSPLDVDGQGLRALLAPAARRIAIGNPSVAPYGAAAEAALRSAGIIDALKDRLVLGQSAQQAAQFAQSGNAQAALLPLSLAMSPPLSREGRHVPVPAEFHPPIVQAGVVLAGSRHPDLARAFTAHLLGPAGRAILLRFGYALPAPR